MAASFALLVLIGPSSGVAAAATPATTATSASAAATAATPAQTSSCFPLTETGGTCYTVGEFCPSADLNMSGVAANGTPIACEADAGQQLHWEQCTRAASTATPASTAAALTCPATLAITPAPTGAATTASAPTAAPTTAAASATPGATTSGPAGAPVTGGGTGPGNSGVLAAAGSAVMVVGAGLVFLSRRRSRRRPV